MIFKRYSMFEWIIQIYRPGLDLGEAPISGASHVTKSRFGRPIRRPKRFDL